MKYISTIKKISFLLLLTVFAATTQLHAQVQIGNEDSQMDYSNPHTYTIGGITATGTQYLDNSILISMTGLHVGNEISVPGDEISSVIRKLWEHGMFEDISINATNIIGDKIFLEIAVKERPRVSKFSFSGIKKSERKYSTRVSVPTAGGLKT